MLIAGKEISELTDEQLIANFKNFETSDAKRKEASSHIKFDPNNDKSVGAMPSSNPAYLELKDAFLTEIKKRNIDMTEKVEEVVEEKVEDVKPAEPIPAEEVFKDEPKPVKVEDAEKYQPIAEPEPKNENVNMAPTLEAQNYVDDLIILLYKRNEIIKYVSGLNYITEKDEIKKLYQYITQE